MMDVISPPAPAATQKPGSPVSFCVRPWGERDAEIRRAGCHSGMHNIPSYLSGKCVTKVCLGQVGMWDV